MFGFRKKSQLPAVVIPRSKGFMSTDFETAVDPERRKKTIETLRNAFQQPLPANAPFFGGKATVRTGMGMDSNIQEVKWLNSGCQGIQPPLPQLDWYAAQTFIGYQTCAIIAQQWLVNKALMMPAEDATRNGYELTANDGEKIDPKIFDYMRESDKRFKFNQHLVDFLYFGRMFGVRHALYEVQSPDPDYYVKPFNPDGVRPGSYRGIVQIDPYWMAPELDGPSAMNPASHNFYNPTWWLVNGKRIHRTHFCIMRNGGKLPDILKPTYFYGGLPLPQQIAERIYAAERTANEAPMLALSKRMTIYKMDLTEAAGDPNKLTQKLSKWSELMNNFGIKAIAGEEEVNQFDLSLADLDAVIMTQYQLVAACASTPATELLGTSPKGFNATGEFEMKSYTKFLKSQQQHHLTPLVEGHLIRLIRSEITPKFGIKTNLEVTWNSTDSPTAAEVSDINLKKSQTDSALVQSGAIDGYDVRQRIISDPDSGYNGIEDIVPGGPGDRVAEQEEKEMLLESKTNSGNSDDKGS